MSTSFIGRSDLHIGLRNNNPGNIRPGDPWLGAIGSNGGFVVFSSIEYGLRALAKDLTNKIKGGYNTINKIVNRYAPASDNNNPAAYAAKVSEVTGIDENQVLGTDANTIIALMHGHLAVEIGDEADLVTEQMYIDGVTLAGSLYKSVEGLVVGFKKTNPATFWLVTVGIIAATSVSTYFIIKNEWQYILQ